MKIINCHHVGGVDKARAMGVKYLGRPSPLGNPCCVPNTKCVVCGVIHVDRGESIKCYERWLWTKMKVHDRAVMDELCSLEETDSIGCWCAPKPCHLESISRAWTWLHSPKVVVATGHRPPRLGLSYCDEDHARLTEFAVGKLRRFKNAETVVSGMALGWDQAIAEAALRLNLKVVLAMPFRGMGDNWPESTRRRVLPLLNGASHIKYVSETYTRDSYFKRDRWMVDFAHEHDGALLALLDNRKEPSGTRITFDYALKRSIRVINVWNCFIAETRHDDNRA